MSGPVSKSEGGRQKRCPAAEGLIILIKKLESSSKTAKKSLRNSGFFTGAVGIEPTSMVLETTVLPLNYAPTTRFLLNRRIVL